MSRRCRGQRAVRALERGRSRFPMPLLAAALTLLVLPPSLSQESHVLRVVHPRASGEILELEGIAGTPTGPIEVSAGLQIPAGAAGVHAWSFGIAHDSLALRAVSASLAGTSGDVPEFASVDLVSGGVVSSVSLGADPATVLPAGASYTLLRIEYAGTFPAKDTTVQGRLRFVDTLVGPTPGGPIGPVSTRLETWAGAALAQVVPTQRPLTLFLTGFEFSQAFGLALESRSTLPAGSGASMVSGYVRPGEHPTYGLVAVLESSLPASETEGAQGWSLSVAHDPAMLAVTTVTTAGTDAGSAIRGGFESHEMVSGPAGTGFISAVVLSFTKPVYLPPRGRATILRLDYRLAADTAEEGARIQTDVAFRDGLRGTGQPINNVVTHRGESNRPFSRKGLAFDLVVGIPPYQPFRRGDANDDARINIADAVWMVNELFFSGPRTACALAADTNGDGRRDLSDVAFLLRHQFQGGSEPPGPFPDCGVMDEQSDADCPVGSTTCAGP